MNIDNRKNSIIDAFVLGAISAILVVAGLTVVADLYKPLKDFLAGVFGHHWTAKGIIAAIIFGLTGFCGLFPFYSRVFGVEAEEMAAGRLKTLFWAAIVSFAALVAFFLWEYLK